jgi:thymidine kinase
VPSDGNSRIAAVIRIPPQRGGWLEVICGPMFSGKSEEMIRRLRRAEIAGQRVVIFKPAIDDRYDASDVVSHAGARMQAVPIRSSAEIATKAEGFDVVAIDEAQFLGEGVVLTALALADRGVRVVVAGLDQDFRRLPFGPMPELLSHAEFVDKLQAVCHRCGGPATTTQRLVDGEPAPYSGDTVVVGAAEQYEARCRGCHEPGVGAALAAA